MFTLDYIISLLGVLLSVAFYTLVERKVMGLAHYRKGPYKVFMAGESQPLADAMKLLTKESTNLSFTKMTMFLLGPSISLVVMLLIWSLFEFSFVVMPANTKLILVFMLMGMTIYGMLLMSWGSNSKYAMLGGYRAVAQVMSYEVCMFILILVIVFMWKSYSICLTIKMQQGLFSMFFFLPVFLIWTMMCLAESNRTPFDMAEGESEIVSGFNIEYGGGLFALIFISEYGLILMLSFLTSIFFLGGTLVLLKMFLVALVFVWTRCAFPRVRYNDLMMLSWKLALPFTLSLISLVIIS